MCCASSLCVCVCVGLLCESDLQVRGEVLSRCECVLPDGQVGNVVDGEAEFGQRRVEFIQAGEERKGSKGREEVRNWNDVWGNGFFIATI